MSQDNPSSPNDKLEAARPTDRPEAEKALYADTEVQNVHAQLRREKQEPTELNTPIPMALVALMCLMFAWAGTYMTVNSGDYRWDVYDPDWSPVAAEAAPAVDKDALEWKLKRGAQLFGQCSACHQASGLGVSGVYPPLAGSNWVLEDERRFAKILLRGLQGEIIVLGNTYNGVMPSYGDNGSNWKDEDLAAVMTYVRSSFGNQGTPVAIETVKSVREEVSSKTGAWSMKELWP